MSANRDAVEAARLQDDAAFQKAVAGLHAMYAADWRDAETVEERERIWYRDAALTAVETELSKAVSNGTFEEAKQTRRDKRGD